MLSAGPERERVGATAGQNLDDARAEDEPFARRTAKFRGFTAIVVSEDSDDLFAIEHIVDIVREWFAVSIAVPDGKLCVHDLIVI